MDRKPDPYAVLGVPETATQSQIKTAFHTLAHRFHPDQNAEIPAVEEVFKQISEAYATLADPMKRKEYDETQHRRARDTLGKELIYTVADGGGFSLGAPIGTYSGVGTVFKIMGRSDLVVKIFDGNEITSARQMKIRAMVDKKPNNRIVQDKRLGKMVPVLAWPEDVVHNNNQECGYVMRALDIGRSVLISSVESGSIAPCHPWTKNIPLNHRIGIALNLAFLVRQVHEFGAVIGDLSERQIAVSDSLLVCLIGCDSMQLQDATGSNYLCDVAQFGYTAPELIGKNLSKTVRQPSSDLFGLAVHVYQLLLKSHPFQNMSFTGLSVTPSVDELVQQGEWQGKTGGVLHIPPGLSEVCPQHLIQLFRRAFEDGAVNPNFRPTTDEWIVALQRFRGMRPANHFPV